MKGMCQRVVSVGSDITWERSGGSSLTCYECVLTAGEQQRQCLIWDVHGHLLSVRTTGRLAGRQGDRQAGDGGVKRQGELSLGVSGLLPAGCNIKFQNDAVSRPADRRIRAGSGQDECRR